MPETQEQAVNPFSCVELSVQLARDYAVYKFHAYPGQAEQLFGPQKLALLKAIDKNPQAAKLVDDYWNKHVFQYQREVHYENGPNPHSIPLSQLEREVYERFVVAPSLISHSILAGAFWNMAACDGYAWEQQLKAAEWGNSLQDTLVPTPEVAKAAAEEAARAKGAKNEGEHYRPGDPYQPLYSPKEKWEPSHNVETWWSALYNLTTCVRLRTIPTARSAARC